MSNQSAFATERTETEQSQFALENSFSFHGPIKTLLQSLSESAF